MELKGILFLCAVVGAAVAQRGHYAGANRPITGSRYQNENTDQSNLVSPAANQGTPLVQNQAAPVQTNQIAPAQSNRNAPAQSNQFAPAQSNQVSPVRVDESFNPGPQQQQHHGFGGGFGQQFGGPGFDFPNPGFYNFQPQGFPFGFNGR